MLNDDAAYLAGLDVDALRGAINQREWDLRVPSLAGKEWHQARLDRAREELSRRNRRREEE